MNFRVLTVICVGASSMSVCPSTFIASTGNTMYGAQVTETASIIQVNLYSSPGACRTSSTFTVTGTGVTQQKIMDLCPLQQYYIEQDGARRFTRVSSSQGVIAFDANITTSATFAITPATDEMFGGYFAPGPGHLRYAAMIAPLPGETFIAPADLRLVGARFDLGPTGSEPASVDFHANDTVIATVLEDDEGREDRVYKTRYSSLSAGTYKIWARGHFTDGSYADSPVHTITVIAPPTYSETISLSADLDISGLTYTKNGSAGSHIKFVGNGYSLIGTPRSFLCNYCDFFDMGNRATTAANGIALTLAGTGTFTLTNSRIENSDITAIVMNSSGTMTIENNLWASNTRQPLGQNAFQTGQAHGSYWVLKLTGTGAGAKTFRGNNVGAGWVDIASPNWAIGGATSALGNVMMGPRVGFWLRSGFTSTVWSHNFAHHLYVGGWSEGSVYELSSVTGLVMEHNIVSGSSWPVRGLSSEFRYNLVTGAGGVEGLVWSGVTAPNIHHNILWGPSEGRHAFHQEYGATGTLFRNNTVDVVNRITVGSPGEGNIGWITGSGIMNSNLVMRTPVPAVTLSGSTSVTTDYNAYFDLASPFTHYEDRRATPAHEVTGDTDPGVVGNLSPELSTPWNYSAVWTRTKTVSQILADWRALYTPTSGVIDNGDTATYGAGNDRGAIGAGTSNAYDLFGTTTP